MSGQLQEMEIRDLSCDVFQVFQHATPLLSAGSAEKFNTMVIGWGGLGTLWGKAVCTVYVRPQRYTYEFMERENAFSVSVLPPECREALRVCGSESGRDVDKVKKCGLTPASAPWARPILNRRSWCWCAASCMPMICGRRSSQTRVWMAAGTRSTIIIACMRAKSCRC